MTFRDASLSFEMVNRTGVGREFTARRRVRLGDATPNGRLRLDALARYLQDVSNDDTRVSEWSDPHWWVVRRTVIDVHENDARKSCRLMDECLLMRLRCGCTLIKTQCNQIECQKMLLQH
jgi:hypothetical protein